MPAVIAHRGASATRPENTLEAFRVAADLGADAVELDVRRTADRVLVVHHDPMLADGRPVMSTTRAELPGNVPTLSEAIDACGSMWVNIELKNLPSEPDFDATESLSDAVVGVVTGMGRAPHVLVSAFHLPAIDRIRALDAGIRTAFLVLEVSDATIGLAAERGHDAYHPWDRRLTRAIVEGAHREGLEVNTWTVDDPDRIAELAGWGVDGIVTNTPDVARAVVDATEAAS